MQDKKTLVLGASVDPTRYANMAIKRLRKYGHSVVAIGNKAGNVDGVDIITETLPINHIDTVTLYLRPEAQKQYYSYILSLHPKRVIFNPGTENIDFEHQLQANNIEPIEACTLVMLNTHQF